MIGEILAVIEEAKATLLRAKISEKSISWYTKKRMGRWPERVLKRVHAEISDLPFRKPKLLLERIPQQQWDNLKMLGEFHFPEQVALRDQLQSLNLHWRKVRAYVKAELGPNSKSLEEGGIQSERERSDECSSGDG